MRRKITFLIQEYFLEFILLNQNILVLQLISKYKKLIKLFNNRIRLINFNTLKK